MKWIFEYILWFVLNRVCTIAALKVVGLMVWGLGIFASLYGIYFYEPRTNVKGLLVRDITASVSGAFLFASVFISSPIWVRWFGTLKKTINSKFGWTNIQQP